MRILITGLFLLALASTSPARADDSTPPELSHTPITKAPPGPVLISVGINSPRKVFPQLFSRTRGGPWKTVDLKKARNGKWEATIPLKEDPIEYYVECFDEIGNGPARVADPDHPILLEPEAVPAPPPAPPPPAPAPAAVARAEPTHAEPSPRATPRSEPAPAPAATHSEPVRPPAPAAAVYADAHAAEMISIGTATWHSAVLPGWGQWGTDRKIRGVTFGALAAIGVVSSVWLGARYAQADNIYKGSAPVCRQAAYDQAVSYQNATDWAIGLTAAVWLINVAESYLAYGTHDP